MARERCYPYRADASVCRILSVGNPGRGENEENVEEVEEGEASVRVKMRRKEKSAQGIVWQATWRGGVNSSNSSDMGESSAVQCRM